MTKPIRKKWLQNFLETNRQRLIGVFLFWLITSRYGYSSYNIGVDTHFHQVAKDYSYLYTINILNWNLLIYNDQSSQIDIWIEDNYSTNNWVSCSLQRDLENNRETISGKYEFNNRIKIWNTWSVWLKNIIENISLNPLFVQKILANIECIHKEGILTNSRSDWINYIFPQYTWNLKILLIDRSNNEWESLYYAKGKKKIIRDIREWFSWSNTLIKTMNSASVSSSENVIFVNTSKHSLTWDIPNDVVKIIKKTVSEYNKLPVVLKPMSKFDYKSMKYYYVNTVKLPYDIIPKFSNIKEDINKYDTRFLDYPENFELDFWIVLHQQ